jgi:hypothetical protein
MHELPRIRLAVQPSRLTVGWGSSATRIPCGGPGCIPAQPQRRPPPPLFFASPSNVTPSLPPSTMMCLTGKRQQQKKKKLSSRIINHPRHRERRKTWQFPIPSLWPRVNGTHTHTHTQNLLPVRPPSPPHRPCFESACFYTNPGELGHLNEAVVSPRQRQH